MEFNLDKIDNGNDLVKKIINLKRNNKVNVKLLNRELQKILHNGMKLNTEQAVELLLEKIGTVKLFLSSGVKFTSGDATKLILNGISDPLFFMRIGLEFTSGNATTIIKKRKGNIFDFMLFKTPFSSYDIADLVIEGFIPLSKVIKKYDINQLDWNRLLRNNKVPRQFQEYLPKAASVGEIKLEPARLLGTEISQMMSFMGSRL